MGTARSFPPSQGPPVQAPVSGRYWACIAKDGTVILALQWDYAGWTSGASYVADEIKKLAGNKRVFIALSGEASPRLQEEVKNLGFAMRDRVAPGPLK